MASISERAPRRLVALAVVAGSLWAVGCTHAGERAVAPTDVAPAAPAGPPDAGAFAPPDDAERLCGGHVTGAPLPDGAPGPHITWDAYASPTAPGALVDVYATELGVAPDSGGACALWRSPPGAPRAVLEVCAASIQGRPWATCTSASGGTASVVMISHMAVAD